MFSLARLDPHATSVRIPGVLEGDNIEYQLTIDSATDIPCIAKTLVDNSIMKSLKSQYCPVITQTGDEQTVPVLVSRKYVIPAAHEALTRVSSTARPQKYTLALIEPRIVSTYTLDDADRCENSNSMV